MGYAIYGVGPRIGGYGVPAVCEQPGCEAEIDRGISYACGGEPFSEYGCDRYFCGKHCHYSCPRELRKDEEECDDECDENHIEVCARCRDGEAPFDYKPETKRWMYHMAHDFSWATWRSENPETVAEYLKALGDYKPPEDDDDTNEHETP